MPDDPKKHHDWRLETYREEGTKLVVCPTCETSYAERGVSNHWRRSDCPYPSFSKYQKELLTGALMGDASAGIYGESKNPTYSLRVINKEFLEWFSSEMGFFGSEVTKNKQKSHTPNMTDHIYSVSIRATPELKELVEWYESGQKRFPVDLELTPTILKLWYVCDGGICKSGSENARNRVQFSVANEQDREDYLLSLFNEIGFDPYLTHHTLRFTVDESEDVIEYMGETLPGFERKWRL